MKIDRDMLQRLLDGEIPPAERDEVLRRVLSDPSLQQEYEDLQEAMKLLEREGPQHAPAGFTAAVMARLPEQAPSWGDRLRLFLFGDRVLRWNMASALALFLLVAGIALLAQRPDRAPIVATTDRAVTVRLSFYAPQAHQVSVAGDFNKWTVGTDVMERRDGGLWTLDLTLQPGRYNYMFVLDGSTWIADPGADSFQDDGFGSRNAVLRIRT